MTVLSRDALRGVPTLVRAHRQDRGPSLQAHSTPRAAANAYLRQQAELYGLSPADLETVYVHHVHDLGRGGIIVRFRQRVAGLEVVHSELKMLLSRDLALVALSGHLQGGVAPEHRAALGAPRKAFAYPPSEAVLKALGDIHGLSLVGTVQAAAGFDSQGAPRFELAPGGTLQRAGISLVTPARVTENYFPTAQGLVPAYTVDLLSSKTGEAWPRGHVYVLHASTGQVLLREDRTANDAYTYRVWASAVDRTPSDNPFIDFSPYPGTAPGQSPAGFTPPTAITWEGRAHPSNGTTLPWLDAGATVTAGNNVRAYADHFNPDGYTEGQDVRAQVTPATRDFPHVHDPLSEPLSSPAQIAASVVQLFYTTNWLHDYYYDSGFNEPAGNAQQVNFEGGGLGEDPVLAEAQNQGPDPQARNSAIAYVPRDGLSPRLEFSLWSATQTRTFSVSGRAYDTGPAQFGAQKFTVPSRQLVLGLDGTGTTTDACEPLQNPVTNAIVLADRGTCNMKLKAVNAQSANAAALIIINNTPGDPAPSMPDVDPGLTTTLPVLSVSFEDGQALKDLLAQGSLSGTLSRSASPERDASLDNTVVAHEWGHILFRRLVACSSQQCRAMSEGWSDFVALHMMVREGDAANGMYAIGAFAGDALGDSSYYGVRRSPYSRDLTRNGFQFQHIADGQPLPAQTYLRDFGLENSEIHNAGEVWASMLFEAYQSLLDDTRGGTPRIATFEEARRRMATYVVESMLMAHNNITFTEQRDLLLMVANERDPADMRALAQGFARRGAGTCAVSPPPGSRTFTEVVQDDQARSDVRLESIQIEERGRSCDADGVLDASETGVVRIQVYNGGPLASTDTRVSLSSNNPRVTFPSGPLVNIGRVSPFEPLTVEIPVALSGSQEVSAEVNYSVVLESSGACRPRAEHSKSVLHNYDLTPSRTDRADPVRSPWRPQVLQGLEAHNWRIAESPRVPGEKVWYAEEPVPFADVVLETPSMTIPPGTPFAMSFEHRFEFDFRQEPSTGERTYWSGGVIEFTRDGGTTWTDVSTLLNPGYAEKVLDLRTGNPLRGRFAYASRNPHWPDIDSVTLDFGTNLSGSTVKLRFRLGSDVVFFAHGWEVDNITVVGTATAPFLERIEDASPCHPIAQAGNDQSVLEGETVHLDGTRSSDPGAAPLTYRWRQVPDTTVALTGADTATPRFIAPDVSQDTELEFELTVQVAGLVATDRVKVTTRSRDPLPDAGPPDAGHDAGTPDAGHDAGTPDAGHDAGTPDAGPPDAGPPDAGPLPDAGPEPDAGPGGGPGEPGGCSCAATRGDTNLVWLMGLVGWALIRGHRRRRG
ncbi:M36 family metallopeptidase [Myxococcus landrumensis]|uniref:M36 family metallopeptidase n=1 Tax=Myxococcus landrumensis TaxID=2813577 RepID=A0ABX7N4B5_9BACT|nr:M36 family metallopeptidase [Myxococcus landrumus]QSQ13473.1 M36 family metallopeptidase [Myxococcus landrumus]